MVAQVNETYTATLELDPRSHQWMAEIEGQPKPNLRPPER